MHGGHLHHSTIFLRSGVGVAHPVSNSREGSAGVVPDQHMSYESTKAGSGSGSRDMADDLAVHEQIRGGDHHHHVQALHVSESGSINNEIMGAGGMLALKCMCSSVLLLCSITALVLFLPLMLPAPLPPPPLELLLLPLLILLLLMCLALSPTLTPPST